MAQIQWHWMADRQCDAGSSCRGVATVLAAVAAGTVASGSIRVKVSGVAGPVERLPAAPAAAVAEEGEGGLGAGGGGHRQTVVRVWMGWRRCWTWVYARMGGPFNRKWRQQGFFG
mgnify:CR=1 FL=1